MPDVSLCVGLSASAIAGLAYLSYNSLLGRLAAIESAQQFPCETDLMTALKETGSIPYAAVSGECFAEHGALKGSLIDNPNAVCLRTIISECSVYWDGLTSDWKDSKKVVSNTRNCVPFFLMVQPYLVSVKEPLKADILDLPSKTVTFEPVKRGTFDFVTDLIKGEELRGIEVSHEALMEGTEVTGIGKLQLVGSCIQLCQPGEGLEYVLRAAPFASIIRERKEWVHFWKRICMVFMCLTGGFLGFWVLNKMKNTIKWYIERRRRFSENIAVEAEDVFDGRPCTICLDRPRNILILPCGHLCICSICADLVETCPICRNNIERTLPFYSS